MNNDYWSTGWDPHQALLQCEQNILQCANAINHGTEVMKDLANKYNHQQEIIQQLQFNNRKLQQMVDALRHEVVRQGAELEMRKMQTPQ
jgi:Mg2+ and Co2+ transporter CorA